MPQLFTYDYLWPETAAKNMGRYHPKFAEDSLYYADGYLTDIPSGRIFTQEYRGRSFTTGFLAGQLQAAKTISIGFNMAALCLIAFYCRRLLISHQGRKATELIGKQLFMAYTGPGAFEVTLPPGNSRMLCIAMDAAWLNQSRDDFPLFQPLLNQLNASKPSFEKMPSIYIDEDTGDLLGKYDSVNVDNPSLRDSKLENYYDKILKRYHEQLRHEHSGAFDIRQYLLAHYHNPQLTTVKALAAHFHLSPRTLSYLYTRAFAIAPGRCLTRIRMRRARILIAREDATIGDAGGMVGYPDIAAFSHAFKKYYGYAPSEVQLHPGELF